MTLYAFAINPAGKWAQQIAIYSGGKCVSSEWTGKVYRNGKEAARDSEAMNAANRGRTV